VGPSSAQNYVQKNVGVYSGTAMDVVDITSIAQCQHVEVLNWFETYKFKNYHGR
jgi:hypothetical protein